MAARSTVRWCALVLMPLALSCGDDPTPTSTGPVVTTILVRAEPARLVALGQSSRATADIRDQNGDPMPGVPVTWSSSNIGVLSVERDGTVTAVGVGTAAVRASASGRQGEALVEVTQEVVEVTVEAPRLVLEALLDTLRLSAQAFDANAYPVSEARLTWSSSEPQVAIVDATGLVTATAGGSTVITARAVEGRTGEAEISVEQVPATLSVLAAPGQARAGEPFPVPPRVEIQDGNGFRVAGGGPRMVRVTLGSGPVPAPGSAPTAVLDGVTSVDTKTGVATFPNLRLEGAVGTYLLEFVSEGLAPVQSNALSLSPGPAATIVALKGDGADVVAGTTLDPASVRISDAFGNPVADEVVEWRVTSGGGSVDPEASWTGLDGVASTAWLTGEVPGVENRLEARLAATSGTALLVTIPDEAIPPFAFQHDTDWLDPARPARIVVVDGRNRPVPASKLTLQIDSYGCCGANADLTVAPDGTVGLNQPLDRAAHSYRIRGGYEGTDVAGLMLVVAHDLVTERTVVATEHWRLVVPVQWVDWAVQGVPDWTAALDVGWEAQKELMGKTLEEAQNEAQPHNPVLPQSSALEDRDVCGISSLPLSFGRDCFTFPGGPYDRDPRWFIIFHELGHHTTLAQQGRAIFCQLLCAPDAGATWVEGDASLFSFWSSYRMMNDPGLSAAARESVGANLALDMANMESQLQEWEASDAPFSDSNDFDGFHAGPWDGVHGRLVEEFGWDWIPRYARAFRNDSVVCQLMRDTANCFAAGHASLSRRATFVAAAVSAAVRTDLRQRFIDLRFPLDGGLYQQLYDHLVTAMDVPW